MQSSQVSSIERETHPNKSSNKKKILGSKQLLSQHHISAQNEGKHVLATSIFQNFLGEHAPRTP